MPLYEYECQLCGPFALLRTISERDAEACCEQCGLEAARVISSPNLALMNPARKKAHFINERSAHEPRVSQRHSCTSGCGCGPGKSKKGAGAAGLSTDKKFQKYKAGSAGSRPWMLGH